MENQPICPECQTPIPGDAPLGQCPKCFVETVLMPNVSRDQGLPREFGDYRLLKLIGSSGMGNVYEAVQIKLNRRVAIKLIKNPDDPDLVRRFYTEAEAAARLKHSNIVAIHDFGMWEGQPFICMDLVEGESLKELLRQSKFKPGDDQREATYRAGQEADICRRMIKLVRAVAYAHEKNVIHRDIKPDNIVVDRQGEPHLIDFGLAKITDPHRIKGTITGQIMGSLPWMAPEQAAGGETDQLTDIHGLGALLYHLLTGHPPFHGRTPKETLDQVLEQPPRRLMAINPLVDRELSIICLKCLEKNRLDRFSTADELAEKLELWLANKPTGVVPPGCCRRVSQWVQRNKLATALIGSLCLALILALAVVALSIREKNRAVAKQNAIFDGIQRRINDFWQSDNSSQIITYQEMAGILPKAHTSPITVDHELTIGFWIENNPLNVALELSGFIGTLENAISQEIGKTLEFNLKFFKWHVLQSKELILGQADVLLVDPLAYLEAQAQNAIFDPVAYCPAKDVLIVYSHTNAGIQRLVDFKGRSVVMSDPHYSYSILTKALFLDAGITRRDLGIYVELANSPDGITNIVVVPGKTNHGMIVPAKTNIMRFGIHDMELAAEKVRKEEVAGGLLAKRRGGLMSGSTAGAQFDKKLMSEIVSRPALPMVFCVRGGLSPQMRRAIQQVLQKAGMVPIKSDSYFDELREVRRKAVKFDGQPAVRMDATPQTNP